MKRHLRAAILSLTFLAAQGATAEYQFMHTPPSVQDLPSPGQPVKLSVVLPKEVLSVGLQMRALVSRDGRLIELADRDPIIDTNDRAVYTVSLPSPLAEMSYQFIFTDKGGATSGSQRYAVRRKCIPNVAPVTVKKPNQGGKVTKDDAVELLKEASGLQKDIEMYDHVAKLLTELKQAIQKK